MNTRARAITISILTALAVSLMRILPGIELLGIPHLRVVISFLIVGGVITIGTAWVLFYKINRKFFLAGVIFPFITFLPFWVFLETVVSSFRDLLGQNLAWLATELLIMLIVYLLILTVNLLNGARMKNVPLAQAAKAAQFVFILFSAYFFFTFIFSTGLSIVLSALVTLFFTGYLTFAVVSTLQLSQKQEALTVSLIGLLMTFSLVSFAIWPISAVYATVVMTVIFYLLLNRTLEIRETRSGYLWLEYLLLFLLLAVILLSNAVWGVNGTIF